MYILLTSLSAVESEQNSPDKHFSFVSPKLASFLERFKSWKKDLMISTHFHFFGATQK